MWISCCVIYYTFIEFCAMHTVFSIFASQVLLIYVNFVPCIRFIDLCEFCAMHTLLITSLYGWLFLLLILIQLINFFIFLCQWSCYNVNWQKCRTNTGCTVILVKCFIKLDGTFNHTHFYFNSIRLKIKISLNALA